MKWIVALTLGILMGGLSSTTAFAEDDKRFKGKSYGSFMFFEAVTNVLFLKKKLPKMIVLSFARQLETTISIP